MAISRNLYQEHDKIMLRDTGQVLTVHADLSNLQEPGIIVKEKIGRLLMACEVRPAGKTREWLEAGNGIEDPEPKPPRPDGLFPDR